MSPTDVIYPNLRDVRLILLQSGDRLLAELPPKLGIYTQKYLQKLGVDVRLSTKIELLGRFDRIGIDTVMRRYFKEIGGQQNATDDDINAYYERFGECKGRVAWWEVSHRADAKGELSF